MATSTARTEINDFEAVAFLPIRNDNESVAGPHFIFGVFFSGFYLCRDLCAIRSIKISREGVARPEPGMG